MAQEVGFTGPVALTSTVWADCVAWTDEDSETQVHQDQSGRLYDVLFMAAFAIRTSTGSGNRLLYGLYRVPRDGHSTEAKPVRLKLIIGPGDHGEAVITILKLNEDWKPPDVFGILPLAAWAKRHQSMMRLTVTGKFQVPTRRL